MLKLGELGKEVHSNVFDINYVGFFFVFNKLLSVNYFGLLSRENKLPQDSSILHAHSVEVWMLLYFLGFSSFQTFSSQCV